MGFSRVYFAVLAPIGLQVQIIPYDALYVTQHLLPSLVDFWSNQVLPAFAERDRLGPDGVYVGWLPEAALARKRSGADASDESPPTPGGSGRPRIEG